MIQAQSDLAERVEAKVETPFNHRRIHKGVLYFVIFTVAGLALLYFVTQTPQTLEALLHLDVRFFSIAIVLSALDMFLSAYRYHIFIRKIKPGVTPWLCVRVNLANVFGGAITPSQTGGAPAQLYIFYRAGVALAKAMFVLVINFAFTLIFFLIVGFFALLFLREHLSQGLIRYFVQYGFLAFLGFFVLFCLALGRPDLLSRGVRAMAKLLARVHRTWGLRIFQFNRRIRVELDSYRASRTHFLRHEKLVLLSAFGLTILMYLTKFTLGYFLMRGVGVAGGYMNMLAIQTLIMLILYFAPTPGGSGIAELSIAALMSTLMPGYLLPIFTLLYRFFLLYLPALLGIFVILAELRAQDRESILKE